MSKLVRTLTVGSEVVTDSGSFVVPTRDNTFSIDIEGMLLSVYFETGDAEDPEVEVASDSTSITLTFSRSIDSTESYTYWAKDFAKSDDGQKLSLLLYVAEIKGKHGTSRLINYTLTAK